MTQKSKRYRRSANTKVQHTKYITGKGKILKEIYV